MPCAGRQLPSLAKWSAISRQLQQRRAELAAGSASVTVNSPAAAPTSSTTPGVDATRAAVATAPPASTTMPPRAATGSRTNVMTPGAAAPRGGIRHSAMGSLLRRLRAEEAEQAQTPE